MCFSNHLINLDNELIKIFANYEVLFKTDFRTMHVACFDLQAYWVNGNFFQEKRWDLLELASLHPPVKEASQSGLAAYPSFSPYGSLPESHLPFFTFSSPAVSSLQIHGNYLTLTNFLQFSDPIQLESINVSLGFSIERKTSQSALTLVPGPENENTKAIYF